MASVGDRFYNEDVGYADMVELPRRKPESKARSFLIGVAVSIIAVAVAIVLVRGSLPEMTPEQIVQLEDYQGQQPPRHIFNLYSLKQEQQRVERKKAEIASKQVTEAVDDTAVPAPRVAVAERKVPATVVTETDVTGGPARQVSNPVAQGGMTDARRSEIRASLKPGAVVSEAAQSRGVASVAPAVNASVVAASSKADVVSQSTSESAVLPVFKVAKDRVNLRSSPAFGSEVLDILDIGQTITVFDSSGQWVHVATNDGTGTTGYIHNTMVERND